MAWPEDGQALIKSFTTGAGGYRLKVAEVENVELLGYAGKLSFEHSNAGLEIKGLPEASPVQCAHCFKITVK